MAPSAVGGRGFSGAGNRRCERGRRSGDGGGDEGGCGACREILRPRSWAEMTNTHTRVRECNRKRECNPKRKRERERESTEKNVVWRDSVGER